MSKTVEVSGGMSLSFLIFVLVKVAGTSFVAWSWLWVFFPIIPVLWLILRALGLMA